MINNVKFDAFFDFTTDTNGYWKNYWTKDSILGFGDGNVKDPDSDSATMKAYHQYLWSKPLPNGEIMELHAGRRADYLIWNGFHFGADSICASFRYVKFRKMLEFVSKTLPDYHGFMEDFIQKTYTIGGSIIFPKSNSINRARGVNSRIRDRWDLTLECIRRYYNGEESPLYETLRLNADFLIYL